MACVVSSSEVLKLFLSVLVSFTTWQGTKLTARPSALKIRHLSLIQNTWHDVKSNFNLISQTVTLRHVQWQYNVHQLQKCYHRQMEQAKTTEGVGSFHMWLMYSVYMFTEAGLPDIVLPGGVGHQVKLLCRYMNKFIITR